MGRKVTADNYNKDPLAKRVMTACSRLLIDIGYVAPVDLLMQMGLLTKADYERWRFGKVPYLEKVIGCNLSKCGRILRILQYHAASSKLKPSHTAYRKWGKGVKTPLRFSKTGDRNVEKAYSCHYVNTELVARLRKKRALAVESTGPRESESRTNAEPGIPI